MKPQFKHTEDLSALSSTFDTEFTAFSVRRLWINLFQKYFSLEKDIDYNLHVNKEDDGGDEKYNLNCEFTSPNGKYAFWKLINKKAIQAEIELGLR